MLSLEIFNLVLQRYLGSLLLLLRLKVEKFYHKDLPATLISFELLLRLKMFPFLILMIKLEKLYHKYIYNYFGILEMLRSMERFSHQLFSFHSSLGSLDLLLRVGNSPPGAYFITMANTSGSSNTSTTPVTQCVKIVSTN